MKKLLPILTVAITMACTFDSAAQLKVMQNGQIRVGDTETLTSGGIVIPTGSRSSIGSGIGGGIDFPSPDPIPGFQDTISTIRIAGNGDLQSGGRIGFGWTGKVSISESVPQTGNSKSSGRLLFNTVNGFTLFAGNDRLMYYDPAVIHNGGAVCVNFGPKVVAPQYLTTSDARAKTDIEPLENMGSLLKEIALVSYRLKSNVAESEVSTERANSVAGSNSEAHLQYGFLAQKVREIYPELVYEDTEGNLSLDYTGFIPILVDAIKGLQKKVEEQQEVIGTLSEMVQPGAQGLRPETMASLAQNRPNPFNASTVISCVVPETAASAFICIYDLNGGQKRRYDIAGRGSVDITVDGNLLPAGMYIYTLIVDGMEIDSKRMILTG